MEFGQTSREEISWNGTEWGYYTGYFQKQWHSVTPKTSASDQDDIQFYYNDNRMQALKNAVSGFIDDTAEQNTLISDEASKHRISIVSYAGNVTVDNDFTSVEGDGVNSLKNTVWGLDADGGTQSGTAMRRAETVMNGGRSGRDQYDGARDNAKKVVIFFTDGVPSGNGSSFDGDVANTAISAAKSMKDRKTTIFSVGVFEGADPNDTKTNTNAYMNAVSSNYPKATSYASRNLGDRDPEGDYYKTADDPEGLDKVFEDIFKTVNTGSGSPTYDESGDPTKDGYITFTDQLGDYMKVDDFKSIVFADTNFTNPDQGTDAEGNTTYTFRGKAPEGVADIYPEGDLSDVVITVKKAASTDLKTGDLVTVKIPASLIPLRYFNVDKTAETMSVRDTYPMRVFFGVSLKDGVAEKVASGELATEDASYVSTHKDANGNVYFLSNSWDGQSTGDTTASFEPAPTNNYYYFTQNTPIYTDEACTQPAKGDLGDDTYYYKQTFYTMSEDGKAVENSDVASFSGSAAEALQGAVTEIDGNAYFKAGTPRLTYISEFQTDKKTNTTGTGKAVLNPNWDHPVVGETNSLTQRLGNNGKLSIEQPGKLAVSKTVDLPDGAVASDYANVTFDFTVTNSVTKNKTVKVEVKGANNAAVEGAITQLTFNENGEAKFSLKHGQTITIEGLSAGDYTVTEANMDGFTAKVDNQTTNSTTATVTAGETTTKAFTNTLSFTSTTLGNDKVFKGTKTLTDREWMESDRFAFVLRPVGAAPMPADAKDNVSVAYADAEAGTGETPVNFQFGDIRYEKPGTYTYTIFESEANSAEAPGVNFSDAVYRVTVTVSDLNKNGKLSASVKMEQLYGDNNEDYSKNPHEVNPAVATFTNSFSATETLWEPSGDKTYTDNSDVHGDETQFTFRVTASDGAPVPDGTTGREFFVTPAEGGSLTFELMKFDADSIGEHTYTVQEVIKDESGQWVNVYDLANGAATYTKDGMTYDASVQTVTVKVEPAKITKDDGTTENVIKVTPVYSNGGKAFAFGNSYTPTPVTMDDNTSIKGTKTLNGRDMKNGETFGFTLEAADATTRAAMAQGGSITGLATTATAQGGTNGQAVDFSFGGATFTKPGTFTFNVKETSWNDKNLPADKTSGMTFDRTTKQVKVTVSDKGGDLKITSVDYGAGATAAAFTNTYKASTTYGANGSLKVSKTLTGRALKSNEFGFTITREGDQGPAVPTNDAAFKNDRPAADGTANTMTKLSGLAFTQDDANKTYTYVVREDGGTLPGVDYDTNYYKVAITVIDNGDGTMKTETTVTKFDKDDKSLGVVNDGIAAFANTYEADPTDGYDTANVGLIKVLSGRDWTDDDTFTFDVTKVSYNGKDSDDAKATMPDPTTPVEVKKTNAGQEGGKSFGFGTLTFTKAGTYVYKVTEQNAGKKTDGVTNSSNEATVTIVVKDNTATGKLEVESATVTNGGKTFTNTYESDINFDDAVDFKLTKTLNGHAMAAKQFKFDVKANATNEGKPNAVSAGEAAKKIKIQDGTTGTVDGAAGADGQKVEMPADPTTAPKLSFTHEDSGKTFSYTFAEQQPAGDGVTEVNGQKVKDGYTYDNTSYTMNITPTDNGNGTMSIAVKVTKKVGDTTETLTLPTEGGKTKVRLDFVNSYAATGTLKGSTDLKGTKVIDGPWAGDKAGFKFSIKQVANADGAELGKDAVKATLPNPAEVTSDENGDFNFGDITFTKAGDYYFQVWESAGLTGNGWTNSTEKKIIKVIVKDNDNGTLTVTKDPSSNELKFTNTYAQTASDAYTPQVIKTVAGHAAEAEQFEFKLEAADKATKYAIKNGDIKSDVLKDETTFETKKNAAAIESGKSETISFTGMTFTTVSPEGGYTFKVTESHKDDDDKDATGIQNSGWTMDGHAYTIKITVTDENSKLVATPTYQESSTFSNTFGAATTLGADGGLKVTKKLTGRDLEKDQFNFTIKATEGADNHDVAAKKLAKIEGAAEGVLSFKNSAPTNGVAEMRTIDALAFDENDINKTFTYTMSEVDEEATHPGYTYDKESATVAITVHEGKNGKIYTTTKVAKGGTSTDYDQGKLAVVPFVNSYEAKTTYADGAVKVEAQKTLTGRAQTAGEFKFAIAPKGAKHDGNSDVASGANTADGKVTFDAINYTSSDLDKLAAEKDSYVTKNADGTWTVSYTAYEKTDKLPAGVTAGDKTSFEFTVTVKDDGDGTLSTTVNYPQGDGATTFANDYGKSAKANAKVTATKTLTGRPQSDGEFTFTVTTRPQGDGVAKAKTVLKGTNTAAADGKASKIDFDAKTDGQQDGTLGEYTFASLAQAVKDGYATYDADAKTWTVNYTMSENTTLPAGVSVAPNTSATHDFSVTVKDDGKGNLTAENPGKMEFSNVYKTTYDNTDVTAKAKFTKVLAGREWLDSDAFTFTITGNDNAPLPVDDKGKQMSQVTVNKANAKDFSFGTFNYSLNDVKNEPNRAKTFTYTIAEVKPDKDAIAGVEYDTHSATLKITLKDDGQGKLTATANVTDGTFANTYSTKVDYAAKAGVTLSKTLSGRDMTAGQFAFTLSNFSEGAKEKLGLNDAKDAYKVTAAEDGKASPIDLFSGVKNAEFTNKDAGKTYSFDVTETKVGGNGYTNDTAKRHVTIAVTYDNASGVLTVTTTVTKDGESKPVATSTVKSTDAADAQAQPVVIPFANGYAASGSVPAEGETALKATKTLTGRPATAGEFTFAVTDSNGKEIATGTNAAAEDGKPGAITFGEIKYTTDSLKAAVADKSATKGTDKDGKDTYTFQYMVSERTDGLNDQAITPNASSFAVTVTVTDNGDGTLTPTVTYPQGANGSLAFTNAYATTETGNAKVTFNGGKTLMLADQNNLTLTQTDIAGKFTFKLSSEDKDAPMPKKTEAKNDAAGNVNFGEVTYSQPKVMDGITPDRNGVRTRTFTYTVIESGSVAGVSNDPQASKTFTVKLTEYTKAFNGHPAGTIVAETNPAGAKFQFINTYAVQPVESSITDDGQLKVSKTLSGRPLEDGEFQFELIEGTGEQAKRVATGKNDAKGVVRFSKIKFSEPGEHDYTLREVAGEAGNGVAFDTKTVAAHASVVDNGDGTLGVAWSFEAGKDPESPREVTFENAYTAASTTVTLGASKVYGRQVGDTFTKLDLKDGQFAFQVKPVDGAPMPTDAKSGKALATLDATNDANGQITFAPLTFDKAGTWKYEVSEVKGSEQGVTYDKTVYTATITVTDDLKGHLTATVKWADGKTPVFTNKLNATPSTPLEPPNPMTPSTPLTPATPVPDEPKSMAQTGVDIAMATLIALLTTMAGVGLVTAGRRRSDGMSSCRSSSWGRHMSR